MESSTDLILLMQTENKDIANFISIPLNFILVFCYFLLCSYIFNINSNKKQKILYVLISASCLTLLNILLPLNMYRTLYLVLNIIIAVIILKVDILRSILIQCVTVMIPSVVETILYFIALQTADITKYYNVIYVPEYRIIMMSSLIIFSYGLYVFVKGLKFKMVEITTNKRVNALTVFSVAMLVMAAQITQLLMSDNENLCITFITNIVAMLLCFFLSISNLSKFCEIEVLQHQIEELELYNKTLLENQDNLRTFKHDYNNVVQAIGGYVISENLEGLSNFYKGLVKDCQDVNRISMLNPEIINNPVVFNIISNKFFMAKQNKIEMNIDVLMNLNELRIKPYELAKILGILIDNAIEAANECENKIVNIVFREENKHNRQVMVIENTYKDQEIDIMKIFEKNYSTKKRNSGIGLWEVNNILNKTSNLNLYTSKSGKFFRQQLELYA